MKNRLFLILVFILAGCGFSSGLYKDILLAQNYIEKREFKKAVEVYQSILIKKPSINIRNKVNDQLGEIYSLYLNDYQKSVEHFYEIVNNSNEPTWQVNSLEKIGKIYFENTKDFGKAKVIYKNLVDFVPTLNKVEFYKFRYALSIFYLNQFEESRKVLSEVAKDNSENAVQSYYYIGLSYFYQRKWEEAITSWFEYLKRESRKDRIIKTKFLLANAYESSEKLKKAYNIYYSILGEYPNSEVIKNRLNSLYKRRVSRKR